MSTGSQPICPKCKKELPVPGIRQDVYECPFCGGRYTLKWDSKKDQSRNFKTEGITL